MLDKPTFVAASVTAAVSLSLSFIVAGCMEEATSPGNRVAESSLATRVTPAIFVGAGDIAGCNYAYRDEATARLLDNIPGTVFTIGDNAYPDGSSSNYGCYNASWGRHKGRTRPVPGNHEYHTDRATSYFSYFGSRAGPAGKGWYSFDLGGWHIVALNSEANLSAQATWLKSDLAAHPAKCTLAYWHRPLFTSGSVHAGQSSMRPFFQILYDAGAEVVLTGHNHQYERFAPQDPSGKANSTRGIREFVVGTGGSGSMYAFGTPKPNSEVRYNGGHGVLKLTLHPDKYYYDFISVAGKSFHDAGGRACH